MATGKYIIVSLEVMYPKGFQGASESDKEPDGEWVKITNPETVKGLNGFTGALNIESKLNRSKP